MFTKPEFFLLTQPYYKTLKQTDEFFEIQSINTGHC